MQRRTHSGILQRRGSAICRGSQRLWVAAGGASRWGARGQAGGGRPGLCVCVWMEGVGWVVILYAILFSVCFVAQSLRRKVAPAALAPTQVGRAVHAAKCACMASRALSVRPTAHLRALGHPHVRMPMRVLLPVGRLRSVHQQAALWCAAGFSLLKSVLALNDPVRAQLLVWFVCRHTLS